MGENEEKRGLSRAGVGAPGSMYERALIIGASGEVFFTIWDMVMRVLRTVIAYYALLLTSPVSFVMFMVRYNMLWNGKLFGFVSTVFFFLWYPFVSLGLVIFKAVKAKVMPTPSFDDGNVFFISPSNPVAALFWLWYKDLSPPLAQFMLCGGDEEAIRHSWVDTISTKKFWRRHLESVGAHVPQELGLWDGEKLEWNQKYNKQDVVVKLDASFLGIGDQFLVFGKDVHSAEDIEACLAKECAGKKDTHVLEWIRPAEGMEVHSLDILTIADPVTNKVEVFTVIYWGDCKDGKSTHSTEAGYSCDVAREVNNGPCAWYAPHFANMTEKPGHGTGLKLPGLKECVDHAVRCHEAVLKEQPWIKMAGWDAICARSGIVFFEGNFAQMRLPRRVFLSWGLLYASLKRWVFKV